MIPLASTILGYIILDKNMLDINGDNIISSKKIKNLSIIIKLAKFKKLDFTKTKCFRIDFFIFKVKKVFIYL